jgi:hypothetical protein
MVAALGLYTTIQPLSAHCCAAVVAFGKQHSQLRKPDPSLTFVPMLSRKPQTRLSTQAYVDVHVRQL